MIPNQPDLNDINIAEVITTTTEDKKNNRLQRLFPDKHKDKISLSFIYVKFCLSHLKLHDISLYNLVNKIQYSVFHTPFSLQEDKSYASRIGGDSRCLSLFSLARPIGPGSTAGSRQWKKDDYYEGKNRHNLIRQSALTAQAA